MKRAFGLCLCLFGLLAGLLPFSVQAAAVFTLGIIPAHSPRVLTERYEPLRAYLESRLKQPVRIESAADFARFQARTVRGEFDLTVTAPHFARLAQRTPVSSRWSSSLRTTTPC
jgi:phosphonate transport system substrate-binding protein